MAKTFEELGNGVGTDRTKCPRCQQEAKAGAVNIRLNKMKEDSASRFEQVVSRQISMCEGCSVEVYEMAVNLLVTEANGGTRAARGTAPRPATATGRTTRRRRTSGTRG